MNDDNLDRKREAVVLACLAVSAPYLARLSAIPLRGEEWFFTYLGDPASLLVTFLFNLLPGYTLYLLTFHLKGRKVANWGAAISSIAYLVVINFAMFDPMLTDNPPAAGRAANDNFANARRE